MRLGGDAPNFVLWFTIYFLLYLQHGLCYIVHAFQLITFKSTVMKANLKIAKKSTVLVMWGCTQNQGSSNCGPVYRC